MKLAKLGPHIGAEVTEIDLRAAVDDKTRRALNAAVVEHVALVIRGQNFTPEQYLSAVALFGEPMEQHFTQYAVPGCPLVHEVSNRHADKSGKRVKHGADWHTDHTNHVRPPKYTSLYAVSLPTSGGDTAVVNMRAGYEALSDEVRQKIQGMKTVNVFQGSASARYSGQSADAQVEKKPEPVLQPLVRHLLDCVADGLRRTAGTVGAAVSRQHERPGRTDDAVFQGHHDRTRGRRPQALRDL